MSKSNSKQLQNPDAHLSTPELQLVIWGTREAMLEFLLPRMPNNDAFWGPNWKFVRDMSTDRLRQMLPYLAHWSAQPWTSAEVTAAREKLHERRDDDDDDC